MNTALVFEGGGGKGAFAQGALKALCERFPSQPEETGNSPISVVATSGTSIGALMALVYATSSVKQGEHVWSTASGQSILPLRFNAFLSILLLPLIIYVQLSSYVLNGHSVPWPLRPFAATVIFGPIFLYEGLQRMFYGQGFLSPVLVVVTLLTISALSLIPGAISYHTMVNALPSLLVLGFLFRLLSTWSVYASIPVYGILVGLHLGVLSIAERTLSIFSMRMLRETIEKFNDEKMKTETYVTVAFRDSHDPRTGTDDWLQAFFYAQLKKPFYNRATYRTAYIPINQLSSEDRMSALTASAALPFGVFTPVALGRTVAMQLQLRGIVRLRPQASTDNVIRSSSD